MNREDERDHPYLPYEDLVLADAEPLWHFANIDRLREKAVSYFGHAEGNPYWAFMRMTEIREILQDPSRFSSSAVSAADPEPLYVTIPEMLDPPGHTRWRQLLSPFFSPQAVRGREPRVRERFAEVLDAVAPQGACDYVAEVAVAFPNVIFLEIMGLPVDEVQLFNRWVVDILHTGNFGSETSVAAQTEVVEYFRGLIKERRRAPAQDLLSSALQFTVGGRRVSEDELLSLCLLLFMAGLDTVAMQLSYAMLHLATHEADRVELVSHPDKFPSAVEEFLRCYPVAFTARKVRNDTVLAGCPLRQGDMVFVPISSANRDPREFPDADEVIIGRTNNRHMAFGAGPHRCLGSHLARQELLVGLEAWHERIPDYHLMAGAKVSEHGGALIGLDSLPLEWGTSR